MRRVVLTASLLIIPIVSGCKKKETPPPPPRTPRTAAQQRTIDSTVGASGLPGSRGVQGALRAQDSAAARQKQLDSIMKAP